MGYYKGEIDGGLGKNSSNAIQKFLSDNPNLVLDDSYLKAIQKILEKKEEYYKTLASEYPFKNLFEMAETLL